LYNQTSREFTTVIVKTDLNGDIVWSKRIDKIASIKSISYMDGYLYLVGEMRDENFHTLKILIAKMSEDGNISEAFTIDGLSVFGINRVSFLDGKILICGELKDDINNKGFVALFDINGSIDVEKVYLKDRPNDEVDVSGCTFAGKNILLSINKTISMMPKTIRKGYLLRLSSNLGIINSLTFANELNISFSSLVKNSFDNIILSGDYTNAIDNMYDIVVLAKAFIYDSGVYIVNAKGITYTDKNLVTIRTFINNDNIYSLMLSFVFDGYIQKNINYHLLKIDGDFNLDKSKVLFSDLFNFGVQFGDINFIWGFNNRILLNLYPLVSNSPVRSMIVELNDSLSVDATCPTEFTYDLSLENVSVSSNTVSASFITEPINTNKTSMNVSTEEYLNISQENFCSKR